MALLRLAGQGFQALVEPDLRLCLEGAEGAPLWSSSSLMPPTALIRGQRVPLAEASRRARSDWAAGPYHGQALILSGYAQTDAVVELAFAFDPEGNELLVQVAQLGGRDPLEAVEHLYRFEKPVAWGGHLVLPHGSGYLVPAHCPDPLPGEGPRGGLVGARWTLPFFGMVREGTGLCATADTWWDCEVEAEHAPGSHSALDFHWRGSLGRLDYPRRLLLCCARGLDYGEMATHYRARARDQGQLRTLEEKAAQTPVVRQYCANVLLRWPAWREEEAAAVLADLGRCRQAGLGITYFFPKWSSAGYSPQTNTANSADAGWQAFLQPEPVPGGWQTLIDHAAAAHALGCPLQGMINMRTQNPAGPEYDEARWPRDAQGQPRRDLSAHDALDRLQRVLDHLQARGLKLDALYFDGYSAYGPLSEDFALDHPFSRRQTYEAQNACFALTRQRGLLPAGEVARFWCAAECDYFFFTDWSSDRLVNAPVQGAPAPVGTPIPLFQLVFHDCCLAGFSGGGYVLYSPGYDWWAERTPRLYELLFAAAPAHNWLPEGRVPVQDWSAAHWEWLARWSAYCRHVAFSPMSAHHFTAGDHTRQRVEFADGAAAEFDFEAGRFRVEGVPGFSGAWEDPPQL